ncbi:MAG: gliding motility-associated C-terminal domain-containing protein, partial [Bacteroidota bacterium]
ISSFRIFICRYKLHPKTMKLHLPKLSLLVCFVFSLLYWPPGALDAQSLTLNLPEVTVADGETVSLPLTVSGFDSIVSIQLSINWNTEIATYVDFELGELPLLAIGDFQAEQGELRLSWFDNTGNGRTLADGAVIANLQFTAIGNPGDFTDLLFTGTPLEVQIFRATPVVGIFEPVELDPGDGRIAIQAPLGFGINSADVSCFGAADGSAQVTLEVNPDDFDLSWTGPDGFSATGLTLDNLSGGVYVLTITDNGGTVVFTYELIISEADSPLELEALEVVDSECEASTGAILSSAIGGVPPYQYSLNGVGSPNGDYSDLSAGNYSLQIMDANACTISVDTMVSAPDAPSIDLPDSLSLCDDEISIVVAAEGTYQWSTGAATDSIVVDEIGFYNVTVTNASNCSASATVEVVAGELPIAALENDFLELCPGDSLQLVAIGGEFYQWLNGQNTLSAVDIPNPIAFPDSTQQYELEVGNSCGTDTLNFSLLVYEVLASAGLDTCIAPGDEAQLMAIGGIFYEWEDNQFPVSDPSIGNPTVAPEDSTTYTVAITDINGCITRDNVTVLVANDPVSSITPYNLISPNNDGFNDVLEFGEIGKFGSNSLKVYNRWGDLVYQKLNYQSDEERFTGLFNGKRLPAGNYFYVLAFRQGEIRQTLTIIWE